MAGSAWGPRRSGRRGSSAWAQTILDRRIDLGLTQVEVADLAGVGTSSVRGLEAGATTITLAVALAVADALGLDLALRTRGTTPRTTVLDSRRR